MSYKLINESFDKEIIEYKVLVKDAHKGDMTADKMDYAVAGSCGLIASAIDVFWVGEFSLVEAQSWGKEKAGEFVVFIANKRGFKGTSLEDAIKWMEDSYPVPSDAALADFGGGRQHHLRDFAHHPTIIGLIFSIATQFTSMSYGTDTEGHFIVVPVCDQYIGGTFEEKIFNATVNWGLHLISDMAGSRFNAGNGAGIPGPILSLLKEASVFAPQKTFVLNEREYPLSVIISKLYNGTLIKDVKFDLRTEIGVAYQLTKQSLPIFISEGLVKAFYFIRSLVGDPSHKDIKQLLNEVCHPDCCRKLTRMLTVSSATFNIVEKTGAVIKARYKNPQNDSGFIHDILININYVGIVQLSVALKRESLFILGDISKSTRIKAFDILEQYEKALPEADIHTKVDNGPLYYYTFNQLKKLIADNRDSILENHNEIVDEIGYLFYMDNGAYSCFESIMSGAVYRTETEVKRLILKMLDHNSIKHEMYVTHDDHINSNLHIKLHKNAYDFILYENEKRVRYSFWDKEFCVDRAIEDWNDKYKSVDIIKYIDFYDPEDPEEFCFISRKKSLENSKDGCFELVHIRDFFEQYFGEGEFNIFLEYLQSFKKEVKQIIGFDTIILANKKTITEFRNEKTEYLKNWDYLQGIPKDVYESQVGVLTDNYLNQEKFKYMLSSEDFAESFISSEWHYSIGKAANTLDKTPIVAGYLKSVEQLLFKILCQYRDTGKTIKMINANEFISFSTENEFIIDKSLGSLIGFVKHYHKEIFEVSSFVSWKIINELTDWRINYRNDHFHQDNVYSLDIVEAIRNKALYLYFLLLGGMRTNKLIVKNKYEESEDLSLSLDRFAEWINPILEYTLLKDTTKILFYLFTDIEGKHTITINTERATEQIGDEAYYRDKLIFDPKENDPLEISQKIIGQYLDEGKFKDYITSFNEIGILYFKGFNEIEKTLYKKHF